MERKKEGERERIEETQVRKERRERERKKT